MKKLPEHCYTSPDVTLYQGDLLDILPALPPNHFDAVLTDPPYASGGTSTTARLAPPSQKYTRSAKFVDFFGDQKDQRSWMNWTRTWLAETYRICKPGAAIAVFIDWRQLPALSDCLQWSEWRWLGVLPWDKRNVRPQKGRFKQQCEFIVWGCKGSIKQQHKYLPGIFSYQPPQSARRHHMTEKPVQLLQDLLQITDEGTLVLDPFAGSASTAIAARSIGRRCVCIEKSPEIAAIAKARLQNTPLRAMSTNSEPQDGQLEQQCGFISRKAS